MSEWLIRPYEETSDLNGCLYMWLKSYAHSPFGCAQGAHIDGSDQERTYWDSHKPIVIKLLRDEETQILCDPESPAVIWAFSCKRAPAVHHYAVVKRKFKEFSADMFRALLGGMLDAPAVYTHDPAGTGLRVPSAWRFDPYALVTR